MTRVAACRLRARAVAGILLLRVRRSAAERYALVVTGASGGDEYAQKYQAWRTAFVTTLREKFDYPDDHVMVLAERRAPASQKATRENVRRRARRSAQRALTGDDQLLVLLIGHGTAPTPTKPSSTWSVPI